MDSINRIAQYEKIAVQKEVMPAASAQNVGKVYQYVGETTGSLTKGMFYEVVSNGSGYSYQVINMGEGASAISQLTDVELTNIQDGEILKYDSASSKFVNATDAGGVSTLADLTDTTITTPTDGQIITYNSTTQKWTNTNQSAGGTPTTYSGGLKSYNTTTDDYSAIQGPCSAGFHIPTVAEATILYSVFTALHQTDNDFILPVLHVTAGGQGYVSGGSVNWETTEDLEYRWTVDTDSTDTTKAKIMSMTWRYGRDVSADYKTALMNIRPFRNGYLPADSTWTLQAGDLNGAYIAENETLGLISLYNGTAGVTIANKNVGATVVYDGNTRDATTTGTYFQWGNNYGFTYNETPASTTSTQVDTSSYSDSTYSSSTCYVGDQQDWSTTNNANLWGATTGVVPGTVTATNVVNTVKGLPPLPALESGDWYTYTLQADHSTGEWVISWVQTN